MSNDLQSTLFTSRHAELGARMAPFAGYDMPIQYADGVLKEHLWTRENAGLFDVSHMGAALLMLNNGSGDADADHASLSALIEPLVSADIAGLKPGQMRYALLLNGDGGIDDDLIVTRLPESPGVLYLVVNAGTKAADFARIAAAVGAKATLQPFEGWALLALQGPKAAEILSALIPGVETLGFMRTGQFLTPVGLIIISRCGYTGEDGFEVLLWPHAAETLWDKLLTHDLVKPIGLGARDSLRLEAGLPLYGRDLDATVSPVEAGLDFAVSKRRRAAGDLPARISNELESGPSRVRVGLLVEGAPAREGAAIATPDGAVVGAVTSGGFSPSLGRPIAMGFVPPALAAPGTKLTVIVRDKPQSATVTALPFVPHNYARKP